MKYLYSLIYRFYSYHLNLRKKIILFVKYLNDIILYNLNIQKLQKFYYVYLV